MTSKRQMIHSVQLYLEQLKKYMSTYDISGKFTALCEPTCFQFSLWNTVYHTQENLELSFADVKSLYEFYTNRNTNGFLITFDDYYLHLRSFQGSLFYLDKYASKNSIQYLDRDPEFHLIEIQDVEFFIKYADKSFSLGDEFYHKFLKLLENYGKSHFHSSYVAFYKTKLCGTISYSQIENDLYSIYNFSILPEFRNQGLAKKVLNQFILNHTDKNMHLFIPHDSPLTYKVLPHFYFEWFGDFNLIDIAKLYHEMQDKEDGILPTLQEDESSTLIV